MQKILILISALFLVLQAKAQKDDITEVKNLPASIKEINCILPMDDSVVWVGTNANVLKIVDDKVFQYRDIYRPEKFTVNQMTFDKENKLWIGTYISTLLRFELPVENTQEFSFIESTNNEYELVTSMCSSLSNIWFGTSEGRIFKYDIYMESFEVIEYPVRSEIFSMYIDDDQTLWVCSNSGLYYTGDYIKWKKVKGFDIAYRIIFKDETYWVIGRDVNQETVLMFSDYNRLLIFGMEFDFKKWTILPVMGVPDFKEKFNDIDFDDKGNIWLALNDGVLMYNPNADNFEKYSKKKYPGLDFENILKIKVQGKNTIWAASIDKLFKITLK